MLPLNKACSGRRLLCSIAFFFIYIIPSRTCLLSDEIAFDLICQIKMLPVLKKEGADTQLCPSRRAVDPRSFFADPDPQCGSGSSLKKL